MLTDLSPLWISLKTAGLATTATFFTGIAAAYGMLGYQGRWKAAIEGFLISPLVLPPTVVGFLLLLLLGRNSPLGQLMAKFDVTIVFTWYGAVVTATVVAFPLMYKTTLGAFEQVDGSLLQVAETLGASKSRIFWRVLVPLSIPGILAGTILAFARALGEFGATLMLAGNIPGQTQTIPMAIYFAVEAGEMQEAWLWVLVIMTLSLSSIVAVNQWQPTRRKTIVRVVEATHGLGQESPSPTVQASASSFSTSSSPASPATNPTSTNLTSTNPNSPAPNLSNAPLPILNPGLYPGLWVDIQKHLPTFTLHPVFSAQPETLGILGGSGSGKSMTLRCIAGIETPSQGRIILNGQTLFDSAQQINVPIHRRKVSLVFQNYALFPHLTVAQNIEFGLQQFPQKKRSLRVDQQLSLLQLQGLNDRYPHQLSGGQQQRVALARALATEPDVLLLDEPFSALDTHLRSQLEQQLVKTLATYRGVTLFVTHNLEEVYRVCNRLMVMSRGQTIALDEKHRIFEQPRTLRVAQLTGCKNFSRASLVEVNPKLRASNGENSGGENSDQPNTIAALDWDLTLQVNHPIPSNFTQVGIRAHQVNLMPSNGLSNCFPGWLAATSETPHRMTLYLKLHQPPTSPEDYHLQVEVFKDKWAILQTNPLPWTVHLDPDRLVLLA